MFREATVLLCILLVFQPSNAIRCFECSSQNDSNCADTFSNSSIRLMDCTQKHVYDLTPIESCLKIKHKEGDRWIYDRGCDLKEKPKFQQAEFYWCTTNYCNAADNNQPKLLLVLLFTSLLLKVLKL